MSKNTIELIIRGSVNGVTESVSTATGALGNLARSAATALGTLAGNLATAAIQRVGELARAIGDTLLNEAPALDQISRSFENLAATAGTSGAEVLASMRAASRGMVSDADLMTSYNEAMLLVGESMATKFPALLEIAQASAAATGQDVGFMLDSLVKGIGRGSPMILDNLGLTINLAEANQKYADSLGISVDQMTKAQQQEALLNATIDAGGDFIERLGDNSSDSAVSIAQMKATMENLKNGIASGLLPVISALLGPILQLAQDYGPQLIAWAENAGAWLGENLPRAIDALTSVFQGDLTTAISNVGAIISDTFGAEARDTFLQLATVAQGIFSGADYSEVLAQLENVFSGDIANKITAAIFSIKAAIEGDLGSMFDGLATVFGDGFYVFYDAFFTTYNWIEEHLPLIRDAITTVVESIKAWFDTNGTTIMAGFLTGWVVVKDTVLAAVDVIWPAVQSMGESLGLIIAQMGEHLNALGIDWDDLGKLVGGVLAVIGALLLAAVGVISGAFNGIAALLDSLANSFEIMSQKVLTVIDNFKAWWADATTFITALFSGDWATAIDSLGKTWDSWWQLVGSVLDTFQTTITSTFDAVLSLVVGFVDGFIGFFGGLIDRLSNFSLREVGLNLIAGLVDGINSAADSVLSAIGGVVQGAIDGAKNLLGIRSPSVVFGGIGENVMLGLAQGIDAKAFAPLNAVNYAVNGLTVNPLVESLSREPVNKNTVINVTVQQSTGSLFRDLMLARQC